MDLAELRDEPWLAAPAGEPSRRAVDRLLAGAGGVPAGAVGVRGPGARSSSLVARGIGIAALPRLTLAAGEGRVAVRELPGRSPARDVYAVARESGVRRPSVAVILAALTAAARDLARHEPTARLARRSPGIPSGRPMPGGVPGVVPPGKQRSSATRGAGGDCQASRSIGQVMHRGPPRPRPSSLPRIVITSMPFSRR